MIPWNLFLSKDVIYIAVIVSMIGGAWYILDDWHYKPLRVQEKTVKMLGEQLNACVTDRDSCQSKLLKENVEGFQEALGDGDENISIDFGSMSTN